jgi:hypothetical protein
VGCEQVIDKNPGLVGSIVPLALTMVSGRSCLRVNHSDSKQYLRIPRRRSFTQERVIVEP